MGKNERWRRFTADTLALLIFSTLGAGFTELVLAGMAWDEVLVARLVAVPVIVITARPYGLYRDWVFGLWTGAGRFGRLLLDTVAFLTFQMPVYATILALAGADLGQIIIAVSGAIVVISVSGRPYGVLLEAVRRWMRVSPRH
ncbi:MAG: L-alanine exporter AlaE [Pseudomonadota bacterium]